MLHQLHSCASEVHARLQKLQVRLRKVQVVAKSAIDEDELDDAIALGADVITKFK